jgi:PAS domain S-box-containing protein
MPPRKKTPDINAPLKAGEDGFGLLFRDHPIPMWIYDLETLEFLEVNHAAVEKYEYTRGEFLGLTIKDIRPAEDVSRLLEDVGKKRPPLQHSGEWRHRLKNGRVIDVEITSHIIEFNGRECALVMAQDVTEQKKVGEALQASEKRFRALIQNGLDNISLLAADGTLLWESPAVISTLNYEPDQFVGRNIFEIMHHDDLGWTSGAFQSLIQQPGSSRRESFRLQDSKGEWHWVEAIATNMLNEPHIEAVVINYRDVTKRRQAEEARKEADLHYRSLFEQMHDGIFIMSLDGRILNANQRAADMLGYTIKELQALTAYKASAQQEESHDVARRLLEGEHIPPYERILRRKDGSPLTVEINVELIKDDSGQPLYIQNVARDITERKRMQDALRASEERFRSYIENATDYIFTLNLNGEITSANQAMCEKLGYELPELLGRSAVGLIVPDQRMDAARILQKIWGGEKTVDEFETSIQTRDGKTYIVQIRGRSLHKDGHLVETLHIARDITESKQAEEELRRSEEKLQNVIRHSSSMFYTHTAEHELVYVSTQSREILDCEPEEAMKRWQEFLTDNPVNRQGIEHTNRAIQTGERQPPYELELVTRRGRKVWVQVDESPILKDGKTIAITGSLTDITERKRAEEALREAEAKYRSLVEKLPAVLYLDRANELGGSHYISPQVEDLLGYPPSAYENDPNLWHSQVYPPDYERAISTIQNTLTEGESSEEYRMVAADGRVVWVRDSSRLLRDADGNPQFVQGFIENITERKQAEERLRRNEEILRLFVEDSPAAIAMFDRGMRHIVVSKHFRKVYRLGDLDIIGKSHYEVFPDLPERWKKAHQRCLEGAVERSDDDFFVHSDGRVDWTKWEIRPWYESDGGIGGIILFVEVITEQKLARDAQRESEERYRMLFENSPVSLWEEDFSAVKIKLDELKQAGVRDFEAYFSEHPQAAKELASLVRILDVNETSVKLFGAQSKADLVKNLEVLLRTGDLATQFRQELIHIANGVTYFEREEEDRNLSGETIHTILTWSAMPGHEQDLSRVVVSIVDVTERKQAEEERRRLIHELGERVKELTLLHDSTRMFIDPSRPEEMVLQEVADSMPAAWQYPQIAAARVGYNGKQFTTPNYRETDWMQSQFFDLPNGDLGFIQLAYLEERPKADEGPFLKEERRLIELLAEKLQTYLRGNLAAAQIKRHLSELETLYESGLAINRLLTPQEIAQAVIEILQRRMDWHHIAIRQYNPQTESAEVIGFNKPGISAEQLQADKMRLATAISSPKQGLSGWVTLHGVSVRVPDLDRDERYVRVFPDIRSGMYVPFKIGERVIGSISVESQVENAFTEEDQRLLETLAGQAAVAIQNAKLFNELQAELIERRLIEEQMRQLNAELEQRVQDRTAQIETVRRRLELATHAGQIGVWECIPAENRVIWDERMHTIHHLEMGAFGGTPQAWAKLIHPDDLSNTSPDDPAALFEWMFVSSEHRILLPNGSARHLSVSAVTVFGDDNRPERMIGICMDVTRNKQAEETLRLANVEMEAALRVKDEFLANMSHELRTPLNAILGISESLEEQIVGNLNEKQLKYVQTIHESGRHLLDLINDILDVSKIEAGRMELDVRAVSVEKLCRASLGMVRELAHKKSLDISLEVKGKVGVLAGDERRLKQALVNLLSNAIKFTESGRRIGLEVEGHPRQNEVTITVWDEGIGIAREDMQFLFKPFVQLDSGLTREYQGTGLGLALVAQIARLHGGRVSVQSEPGRGSRFAMTLPWDANEQNARAKVTGELRLPREKPVRKRSGKILLIEDTESIVALMEQYLSHLGYHIHVARNGVQGIILAKQEQPNLILMDVMMPIMDGLEATRILRADKETAAIPIIAMTALAMPGDRERCLAAGMNDYLSKPIRMDELADVIERHLEEQRKGNSK